MEERDKGVNVLSGVCAVVHEEKVDVVRVLDEESLVAGGHQVARLLVGAVADLKFPSRICQSNCPQRIPISRCVSSSPAVASIKARETPSCEVLRQYLKRDAYRWHSSLTLKPPSDAVVDTLGLPP